MVEKKEFRLVRFLHELTVKIDTIEVDEDDLEAEFDVLGDDTEIRHGEKDRNQDKSLMDPTSNSITVNKVEKKEFRLLHEAFVNPGAKIDTIDVVEAGASYKELEKTPYFSRGSPISRKKRSSESISCRVVSEICIFKRFAT